MKPVEYLAVQIARELIAAASAPSTYSGQWQEEQVAEVLTRIAEQAGLAVQRQQLGDGRCNVAIKPDSESGSPRILLVGHMDTVDAAGMPEPFAGIERAGRLYGRGACDAKGPLAVALATLIDLKRSGRRLTSSVELIATVDEERQMAGAKHLAGTLEPADLIVALEPTSLRVINAHKGSLRLRIHTSGQACHSSKPALGRNAIEAILPVLQDIRSSAARWLAEEDPELGRGSLAITTIHGGTAINIVPDQCCAEIDIRLLPGTDARLVQEQIDAVIGNRGRLEPAFIGNGMRSPADHPYIRRFQAVLRANGVDETLKAVDYCTDCAMLGACGPCIVWGPGDIAQAHSDDEYIELEQLQAGCRILGAFLT